ncbi:hypothetical protein LY76DRAFT_586146 [Colletotrichum caudatum]|nr:hypothetical protein LY76DRAFT_586146 [Colletotrichum caudatum]
MASGAFSQTCIGSNKPRSKSTVFHGSLHCTTCRFGNRGHFGSYRKTRGGEGNATMMRRGPLGIRYRLRQGIEGGEKSPSLARILTTRAQESMLAYSQGALKEIALFRCVESRVMRLPAAVAA